MVQQIRARDATRQLSTISAVSTGMHGSKGREEMVRQLQVVASHGALSEPVGGEDPQVIQDRDQLKRMSQQRVGDRVAPDRVNG